MSEQIYQVYKIMLIILFAFSSFLIFHFQLKNHHGILYKCIIIMVAIHLYTITKINQIMHLKLVKYGISS